MNERRKFLMGAAAMGLGTWVAGGLGSPLLGVARAAEKKGGAKGADSALLAEVAKAAADCVTKGEACEAHCKKELAAGNQEMAKCNQAVHDMLAVCRAMKDLAADGSAMAHRLAGLCADACKTCEDACAEHKAHFAHGMHLVCKDCMESCQTCEKACRKLLASADGGHGHSVSGSRP